MPTKNIEPKLRLISEYTLLEKDDVFEIPQYQRAYSWTTLHCIKLWQDIESFIDSVAGRSLATQGHQLGFADTAATGNDSELRVIFK